MRSRFSTGLIIWLVAILLLAATVAGATALSIILAPEPPIFAINDEAGRTSPRLGSGIRLAVWRDGRAVYRSEQEAYYTATLSDDQLAALFHELDMAAARHPTDVFLIPVDFPGVSITFDPPGGQPIRWAWSPPKRPQDEDALGEAPPEFFAAFERLEAHATSVINASKPHGRPLPPDSPISRWLD